MRNLTEREALEVNAVFSHIGWQYFEEHFLPELNRQITNFIKEPTADMSGILMREQNIGKLNLSAEIVDKFKTEIDNHVNK